MMHEDALPSMQQQQQMDMSNKHGNSSGSGIATATTMINRLAADDHHRSAEGRRGEGNTGSDDSGDEHDSAEEDHGDRHATPTTAPPSRPPPQHKKSSSAPSSITPHHPHRHRSSTRSKMVGGKWSVNAVGQVVFKNHESYSVMRQIQMGLRTAISDITPKKKRDLQAKDFGKHATIKWSFLPEGTLHTPPHDYDAFRFYDYCPMPFRQLRERFGIDASHFLVSLCHDKSLSILGTPGKSGALFFFSADMQYLLKTISKKESKFLRKILPQYYNHIMSNPSTLVTKIYGLYSIKPYVGKNVRFVIMNNVFDTTYKIEERYDLKGSTVGRTASEKELERDDPVLKDMDLLQKNRKIRVGPDMKKKLVQQLKSDSAFLESLKIMDYSLLLGIHRSNVEGAILEDMAQQPMSKSTMTTTTTTRDTQPRTSLASSSSSSALAAMKQSNTEVNNTSSPKQPPQTGENEERASEEEMTERDNTLDDADGRNAKPSSEVMSHEENHNSSFLDTVKNRRPSFLDGLFRPGTHNKLHLENQRGHRISEFQRFHGGTLSSDGQEIYFLGIIDLLQMWNNRKQMERMLKGFRYDRTQISSVSPKKYASRFLRFLDENIV